MSYATAVQGEQASKNTVNNNIPRTAWGVPDMQGNWDFRTITPFERPPYFKDRDSLNEVEARGFERAVLEGRAKREELDVSSQTDLDAGYNTFFMDQGDRVNGTMRTSLIIKPINGRLPPRTDPARKRHQQFLTTLSQPPVGPEDRTIFERCLMARNSGPPITPGGYNNMLQIVQTPDHVVLQTEMINEHRIIPTGAVEGLPAHMRLWKGDSRGAFEDDTFVVTTSNFTADTAYRGTGPDMKLTERFTLLTSQRLLYEYTVEDMWAYFAPWSVVFEMTRTDADLFEYACHEGNYAMPAMLKAARRQEREGIIDNTWLPSWYRAQQQ
ncbi:MAG: hypothetical protein O3A63_10695 [Proteobacteria bacterium]|nr:hypothetical protein [Pseudomonadota bacterium]